MGKKYYSQIEMLAPVINDNDVVTKKYLDDAIAGKVKAPVKVISTTNIVGTYSGGDMTFAVTTQGMVISTAIDYATGVLTAIVQKKLSSAIGYKGIIRKVVMFLMIGVADLIDRYLLNMSVGGGEIIRDIVICFFLINECLSIMENAALIGLPIPKSLKELLLQIREKMDKKKEDDKSDNENKNNNGNDDDWENE